MKTYKIISIISFIILCSYLASEPIITIQNNPVKIPSHVKYKTTSDKNNNQAIEALKKLCSNKKYQSNEVPDIIMAGPRLWDIIKNLKPITDAPSIKAHIRVPINGEIKSLEAGVIRFKERTYNLLFAFKNIINNSTKVIIRKANENELSYYWMIIAFDIEEPLFVIELDKSKYLIHFNDNSEFFYIEEVSCL